MMEWMHGLSTLASTQSVMWRHRRRCGPAPHVFNEGAGRAGASEWCSAGRVRLRSMYSTDGTILLACLGWVRLGGESMGKDAPRPGK